jgi:hypothetical protein
MRLQLALTTRLLLGGLEAFIAIGALYGGIRLLVDPEGFGLKQAWLAGSPFSSYTIPAVFLLVMIAGGMIAAALLALWASELAALAGFSMGVTLLAFLIVETWVIGFHSATQIPLLVSTGMPAGALVALGSKCLHPSLKVGSRPHGNQR